ncbi:Putative arginine and proline rich protein [Mycobacterium tuberculosis variant bovis]
MVRVTFFRFIDHRPCRPGPSRYTQLESPGYRSWRSQTRRSRVQRVATISPVAIANPAPGDNAARKTGRGGARQSPQSRVQRVATISPVAIANPAPGDNAARKTGRGGARQSPQSRVQRVATG